MAGLIYFVEAVEPIGSMQKVEALGLGYAFDSRPVFSRVDYGTPSGRPGTLLCDESRLGKYSMAYYPDAQTWRRFVTDNGPAVWIGYYNEAKPTPQDLARPKQLPGIPHQLCDGNEWTVPMVYVYEGQQQQPRRAILPRYVDVDQYGKCVPGDTLEQYAYLLQTVEGFWQSWVAAYSEALEKQRDTFLMDWPQANEDAATVLGANYYLSLHEMAALRLFAQGQTAGEVLRIACDCENAALFLTYQWQQKKTESVSLDTSVGNAA